MKASELIEALKDCKEVAGDVELLCHIYGLGMDGIYHQEREIFAVEILDGKIVMRTW